MNYPIAANVGLVNEHHIRAYIETLFGGVDWGWQVLALRGVGEKGTDKEGRFTEPEWYNPADDLDSVIERAIASIRRWSQFHVGAFLVPAVLSAEAAIEKQAGEDKIAAFTSLVVDIDKGDTQAALSWTESALGPASMIVASGGVTAEGQSKLHAYWMLREPTQDIAGVQRARRLLAEKVGGDTSFGRAPQIIRIPGSVHAKNGQAARVSLISARAGGYELAELAEIIEEMRSLPGLPEPAKAAVPGFDFASADGNQALDRALHADIHEGGDVDRSRWSEFSRVAGLEIHYARQGRQSLEDAARITHDWMLAHMVPPWPDERFRQEFLGLINADIASNGPMPPPDAPQAPLTLPAAGPVDYPLQAFSVSRLMAGPAPKRRFLVDGLIMAGKPQALVAAGGIGKTFLCLELGLAIANGPGFPWLASKVGSDAQDGAVVLITAEDDKDELHARLEAIDPQGALRKAAGDRFITLPLPDVGGAFAFVEQDQRRNVVPARKWQELCTELARVPNLCLVIIDTFSATAAGDENTAEAVNAWFRAATEPICGKLKAALLVTHHMRKSDEPIKTPEEALEGMRGSSALGNNLRNVLCVWPEHAWKRELALMGLPKRAKTLFKLAVVKANNPEMDRRVHALVRDEAGRLRFHAAPPAGLTYVTDVLNPVQAWTLFCIERAAEFGRPYTSTGKEGLFARRAELPTILGDMTREQFSRLADALITAGLLERSRNGWLDRKDGKFTLGYLKPKDGAYRVPDFDEFRFDERVGRILPL